MKRLLGGIFARGQSNTAAAGAQEVKQPPQSTLPALNNAVVQQLDVLLRGLAMYMKTAIAKILEATACDEELQELQTTLERAMAQFQQQACELSEDMLREYFSSPTGLAFCEQTAFPSLVLDFMGKMRKVAMRQELCAMIKHHGRGSAGDDKMESPASCEVTACETQVLISDVTPVLEFLTICVVAVASIDSLMETYRCEVPNLIALTAEEYPPTAVFIRDGCSRALLAVPKQNFNAGLAWYLLDCNVVAKTVSVMTNYSFATATTAENAVRALEIYTPKRAELNSNEAFGDGMNDLAAEAAVSEALGLTRARDGSNERSAVTPPESPLSVGMPVSLNHDADEGTSTAAEVFCLSTYDVRIGLKAVIYMLENTYRFTLALLDEFQTSGGYTLLLSLLDTCTEEEIPTLLNMLTHLIPLGSHSSDGNNDRVANALGARNVNAFATIRDLLLKYITMADQDSGDTSAQNRNEHLVLQLLTHVLHVYTSDYDNFAFIEPKTRTLALLLTKLPQIVFYDAQVIILRVVEYVCCAARPDDSLHYEILSIVCGLLIEYGPLADPPTSQESSDMDHTESQVVPPVTTEKLLSAFKEGPSLTLSTLMCECFVKILQSCESVTLKKELCQFGLLERGIYSWLLQISSCFKGISQRDMLTKHIVVTALKPHLKMYSNIVCLVLRNNAHECVQFRQAHMHQALYDIAETVIADDNDEEHLQSSSLAIMAVFTELAAGFRGRNLTASGRELTSEYTLLQHGIESDFSTILEILQQFRGCTWRQNILLRVVMNILKTGGPLLSVPWKGCQGYEILVALLSSLYFTGTNADDCAFEMVDLVLNILIVTLDPQHGGKANSDYFKSIDGYTTISSCIVSSGVINTDRREGVVNRVFDLITGVNPPNEIRNGDSAQLLFRILPTLPTCDATSVVIRLLGILEAAESNSTLPKRDQIDCLVVAGALRWMHDPQILEMITQKEHPLRLLLLRWVLIIATDNDLSIPHLQEFLKFIGKTMPTLLSSNHSLKSLSGDEGSEIGIHLLDNALRSPAIHHIPVGKPQGSGQIGRYVHIVNSADRVWPPSSGYSFSCWLQFPAGSKGGISKPEASEDTTRGSSVSVALCEGSITITPMNDSGAPMHGYGVLVGSSLTLFSSYDDTTESQDVVGQYEVESVDRSGQLEFSFRANTQVFRATFSDVDNAEMWWRAIKRCKTSPLDDGFKSGDELLATLGTDCNAGKQELPKDTDVGSACILSVYSLESPGCFLRVFFEQSTGFLRFHTGGANAGSAINSTLKRTSIIFEDVAITDLQPCAALNGEISTGENSVGTSDSPVSGPVERKRDWHHFAFTHRKAVVGSSLVTVYIDGREVATKKLMFPSLPSAGSFQAFVGSDTQVCSPHSALSWKIGPAWFTDDIIQSSTIASMFSLGPTYSYQFSGHSYRSVGDWVETLASSHLARAADRGIEITEYAKRLQLSTLERSCRRQWNDWNESNAGHIIQNTSNDSVAASAALITESMIAKKDELAEGFRIAAGGGLMSSRKGKNKVTAFRNFINYDCAMSSYGTEIESHLGTCKIPEDTVLFTLNTDHSKMSLTGYTQVHYINCEQSTRLDLARSLSSVGGISQVLLPLLDNSRRQCDFRMVLKMLGNVLRRSPSCLAECLGSSSYNFVASLLCSRSELINEDTLACIAQFAISGKLIPYATVHVGSTTATRLAHPVIVDSVALTQVLFNCELRKKLPHHLQCQLVSLLMDLLVESNPNALFNARQLRRAGMMRWIITYLSELGNEECELDQATALEMKWCFPKFTEPTFEAILQYALSLLRAFLRIECHVDDFNDIAEVLLISRTTSEMHSKLSPIRLVLLQFLLHEIEHDAASTPGDAGNHTKKGSSTPGISTFIVETILYCEPGTPRTRKRDEKRFENSVAVESVAPGSPLADPQGFRSRPNSSSSVYRADNFAIILLGVIEQDGDDGRWISAEALLALRILLSLSQMQTKFAEHLLCQPTLARKLRRALMKYSTDASIYIPLLAYVSNIPIGDTVYYDPDTLSATDSGLQSFSLPPPSSSASFATDHVWDLIGALLHQNCVLDNKLATDINVLVLEKIAFQVQSSFSFFGVVCKSSGTLFRIIVECLLYWPKESQISSRFAPSGTLHGERYAVLLQSITNNDFLHPGTPSTINACLGLINAISVQALFHSDEFASLIMYFLECLDNEISKQSGDRLALSRSDGQECWLAMMTQTIISNEAIGDKCTPTSLRSVCTLCIALSRYLVHEVNHHVVKHSSSDLKGLDIDEPTLSAVENTMVDCFGLKVFYFVLHCSEMLSTPTVECTVGFDQQQFLFGSLVFCLQTIVLNEFGGAHKNTTPSQNLLNSVIKSKATLLQPPKWQGVISCGVPTQTTVSDNNGVGENSGGGASSGRPVRRMHRIRSLSTNAHKEFGVGTESDRSFIFSLAAELFKMLTDDCQCVRYSSIVLWQFLMNERSDVIKELLIAEPRTSLLHSITTAKKETPVDVFHGGFDRILFALPNADSTEDYSTGIQCTDDSVLNQDVWCQFQLWLTENISMLTDLIVVRTDPIHRHIMEVLLACVGVQKMPDSDVTECLNTNFPIRLDVRSELNADDELFSEEPLVKRGDIIVSRALMKFSSDRSSEMEAMSDGMLRWRETSLRLANSRNIWCTGTWQIEKPNDENVLEKEVSAQSIFQRRSLRYSLDSTEGPQRMKLRLVRDFSSENKLTMDPCENSEPTQGESNKIDTDAADLLRPRTSPNRINHIHSDPVQRSLEFHDAVEAFREVVYLQTSVSARSGGQAQLLQNILSRCRMDSTCELFSSFQIPSESELMDAREVATLARRIYEIFLEDNESSSGRIAGVSPAIIAEIHQLITAAADDNGANPLYSTLFDAADAEATQYALFAVRGVSSRSLDQNALAGSTVDEEKDASDDEGEDETPTGSALPIDGEESDGSDNPDDVAWTTASEATPVSKTSDPSELYDIPTEATSPKSEQVIKRFDTSSDSVYGAIARYIHRDDYPPIRSYNATYIIGMAKTPGIFVVARTGIYFIGGYAKISNVVDTSTSLEGFQKSNVADSIPDSAPGQSDTPKSGKRKTTKALFRAALADLSLQFTQSKGSGDQCFTVAPREELPAADAVSTAPLVKFSRWSIKYANVKQFCRIKYQLRPVGIEFFDTFGATYFLQLESSNEREEIVKLLFQMPLVNSIFWTPVLRTGALVPSVKKIRHALTKRWLRGNISNFEYLIHLNTLAGRSFNDLTQYPVFPWVIADYTSDFLDYAAKDTFRDLSKPMGAIGESRALQFCERYAVMNQDVDIEGPMGTPAFHYGTHYSCSAYVINYLIRLEPFTALALELQGGVFDHPDRLFRSIPASWNSASRENLQDVRELIPEFFYLPEFLYNVNDCAFGTTQSGEEVCHVILPPWAHNDPREFVRLHRKALESPYVSEHLHEWIDLVFGAKQTGKAAVKAQNVFMHITYEGTVDIEEITDPVMRAATLSQIENFGQTPSRLFSNPHPQRKVPTLQSLQPVDTAGDITAQPGLTSAVGHQYDGNTISSIEAYVKWHTPLAPALVSIGKDYVYLKKQSVVSTQVLGGVGDLKLVSDKMQCLGSGCIFVPPRFVKYLDWGNGGGVMKLRVHPQTAGASRYREANKVLAVVEGAHHGLVNCAAISDDGALLVTGGQDAVVNLIECSKAPNGRRVFKQMAKLVGHSNSVTSVAINKELNLVASASEDCSVVLWDLRTRALLQELAGHSAAVAHVSINSAIGNVLTTTDSELRLWSINGDLLAASSSSVFGLHNITCAISTRCESWQNGVVAVTGHSNGAIALWGLRYPSDLARQKKELQDASKLVPNQGLSGSSSAPSSPRGLELTNSAVAISIQGAPASSRRMVIPSCQLFVLKLLLDHRVRVTALTLGPEQRQLLSGDAEGNCIRWMDDSISINIH